MFVTGTPAIQRCLRCGNSYIDDHEGWTCTAEVWHTRPTPEQVARFFTVTEKRHKPGCKSVELVKGMTMNLIVAFDSTFGTSSDP